MVGLAGIVMYGLYYGAYSTFYGSFGLTPEDVGISWPQAFGRMSVVPATVVAVMSGPFVILLLVVAAAALGLLVSLAWARRELLRRFPRAARAVGPGTEDVVLRWAPPPQAVALAVSLVAFDAAKAYSERALRPVDLDGPFAFVLFVLLSGGACALLRKVAGHRMGSIVGCVAVALLIASASIALNSAVRESAVQMRDEGRWGAAATAVGVVPQYVTVDMTGSPAGSGKESPVMLFLGSAEGVNALYDCASRTVLRIEAQNVTLTHLPATSDADLESAADRCQRG
ncbi:hypothetical protein E4P39_10135 [Blastococcus sp. CT_GayMR19]|uniref:hypothetical protein n=1 Tax=Blastococcus sp. CT_GayMR19 TaxID=2559608 RepID=UPI001074455B|nr:hypothetical protein [Blastococcus sp. CT_GayMR19]TFV75414.1 hypothetical protein E4P39_10135 [Blastococcus sp. CT_GayMR19]